MSIACTFSKKSEANAKPHLWFSRRHQSREAHDLERARQSLLRGLKGQWNHAPAKRLTKEDMKARGMIA